MRTTCPTIEECVTESMPVIGELRCLLFGPDKDGTWWQPTFQGGLPFSGAFLRFFQTIFFYKIARYQSEFLYRTNGYAEAGVESLLTLVLGQGFTYKASSEAEQKRLDRWLKRNKWNRRSRERFLRLITQGETFDRLFGTGEDSEVRFVDPDLVYDDSYMGIIVDPTDYETVDHYVISGKTVPAKQVQHRKLGLSSDRRGVSILFSISQHLMAAERLAANLVRTADMQSKFAVVREHEGNQASMGAYRDQIRDKSPEAWRTHNGENYENYPSGAIVDTPTSVKWNFPGAAIDASKFVEVLRAVLRLCAARMSVPENCLSQDQDSLGAYNAALVPEAHCAKAMLVWQQRLVDWDLELLEMAGFDPDTIQVKCPEVSTHDPAKTVQEASFLLSSKIASKQTVAKMFEIDYLAELEIMDEEPEEEAPGAQVDPQENGAAGLDTPSEEPQERDAKDI